MGLADDVRDAGMDGLLVAAHAVLEEAKRNIGVGDPADDPTPEIRLADSGSIERTPFGYQITFTTAYAAKQHEDLRLQHPRGGGPKYLERALTTLAPTLEEFVAAKVHAYTARGLR